MFAAAHYLHDKICQGQPLLVNIQPSQVANVIIPHGSTTALIFGGASEPRKNGQYFDDPSPYPEQENTPAFPTGDRIQNDVPQITSIYNAFPNVVNQKPVSGMINVESQKVKYGVDINAPPLSFSVTNNGMKQIYLPTSSTGVVNLDSHIINHDISVHGPPISFSMINSGNDFTAHIISHDPKFNPPIVHNVVSKEPPKVTVPYFTSGDNRPLSFNKQKIPTFTYSETGDMNINVSPQPLPNLSGKDHVAPNGIVLDGANDVKPPNTDYTNTRPYKQQQGASYLEHLTPPPPPEVHPRPRPVSYAPKINPLQFMTPPPISIPHIKTETYPKPLTIPLNYDTVSLQKYGNNSTVVADYSNEEYSDDSKEDVNEHGEVIQESKTRPLRPGQVPHEILKMNSSSTTTRRPYTHNYKNTYPYLHPVKVNTDYPRPFRPAVHEAPHKSTTLQRNKTKHRVTIPIKERPHFISPKPNVHEPHRTTGGLKVSRPHFSTSMPIQTNEPHFLTGNIQNIFNLNQYRPTSMPVDPKEEDAPSSPQPINHTHHSGTQTEKPFSGNYTSNNEGVNGSTIQTFSFSNNELAKKVAKVFECVEEMACLMDCVDIGPPPDSILYMPPPPAPSFLLQRLRDNATSLLAGASPCAAPLCLSGVTVGSVAVGGGVIGPAGSGLGLDWEPARGDYVELPRQDVGTADDTWPLVLVAASVGVLVLGALLALFLLRQHAKEQHRVGKTSVQVGEPSGDARAVCWAALTPRGGTQHFVSVDEDEQHHYETVDGPWYRAAYEPSSPAPEYEEPSTPAWMQQQQPQQQGTLAQQDMRCINSLRRPRPRVSPPTRIEHPNLPPLNLNPLPVPPRRAPTVGTLSRRPSETGTILKYNMN